MDWKRHIIFIVVLGVLVLQGCSFLDEKPSFALTEEETYASMDALRKNAVLSIYRYIGGVKDSEGLQGTGRGVYDLNSFTTDEQIMPTRGGDWYDGGYWQKLHLHAWDADDRSIDDTWCYLFKVVMLCTKGIEQLQSYNREDANQKELTCLIAELRALRAMYYFYLVDMYGRVPVVTKSTVSADSLELADRKDVYSFAVNELREAKQNLSYVKSTDPLGALYGRMTCDVAQFVLMKLYLNHPVYTGSEQKALYDSVLTISDDLSLSYSLEDDLMANFSLDNERSRENIFVIPREVGLYDARYNYFHRSAHYNHAVAIGIGGENGTSATLQTLKVFGYKTERQDPRFDRYFYYDTIYENGTLVMAEDGVTPLVYYADKVQLDLSGTPYEKNAGARLKKYEFDPNGLHDATVGRNDIVLFRYADVLLMRAEALVRLGRNASSEVNAVRSRAGAAELELPPTLDDIYYERWRELMWEGWHRNDMIRFGKWTTDGLNPANDHTTVFPIPEDMMVMHPKWIQNSGY